MPDEYPAILDPRRCHPAVLRLLVDADDPGCPRCARDNDALVPDETKGLSEGKENKS
jgi:hypothetical protein